MKRVVRTLGTVLVLGVGFTGQAAADDADDRALASFRATFTDACFGAFQEDGTPTVPVQRYETTSVSSFTSVRQVTLWQFRCDMGAYNELSVFFTTTENKGIIPLGFSYPDLRITLEDPEDSASAVRELEIIGWSSTPFVTNAQVDAAAGHITEHALWRGIGDASNRSRWALIDERARLFSYEVDPHFDGEMRLLPIVTHSAP